MVAAVSRYLWTGCRVLLALALVPVLVPLYVLVVVLSVAVAALLIVISAAMDLVGEGDA